MTDISKIDTDRLNGSVAVGDICYSLRTEKEGWLLCDGSVVSRDTYNDLFEIIGTTFGEGDSSTTFNLPNYKGKFLQMISEGQSLGQNLEAGLPNITGSFTNNSIRFQQGDAGSGALSASSSGASGIGTNNGNNGTILSFDASLSNSIYGKSETVQPESSIVNYFIKY